MVHAGERHQHKGITLRVVEVTEYRTFSGQKELMIAYRLIDKDWESPTAHFWLPPRVDPRPKVEKIIEEYLRIRDQIRR